MCIVLFVRVTDVVRWLQALITGPCSGVPRQAMSLTNLTLTRFTIKIPHSARDRTVRKSFQSEKIKEKWLETALAKRIALREKRAKLTDFDRFKIKCLKQQVCSIMIDFRYALHHENDFSFFIENKDCEIKIQGV